MSLCIFCLSCYFILFVTSWHNYLIYVKTKMQQPTKHHAGNLSFPLSSHILEPVDLYITRYIYSHVSFTFPSLMSYALFSKEYKICHSKTKIALINASNIISLVCHEQISLCNILSHGKLKQSLLNQIILKQVT